ncbi:MAG: HAD-IA family hydrolase [Thainema sp.]
MPQITHIIYDFDGLLLDTEPIHWQVNADIANRYGKTFDLSVHTKIIGRTSQDSAQIIIDMLGLPLTVDSYLEERDGIIFDLYPHVQPMPGAIELTQHFYNAGIPQAIATSSARMRFNRKVQCYADWLKLFDCIVTGDDPAIEQGKPAPDMFLITAERIQANPKQCLVFEDSLAGVTAAKQAGMFVVAVPAPELEADLFQEADLVLSSLADFQPELCNLPAIDLADDGYEASLVSG